MKLDKYFFGFKKEIFICSCYIPPVSSPYYDEDFSKLESEVYKVSAKGNTLIMRDLSARISNKVDFIEWESTPHVSFQNILSDDYCHDINLRSNYVDKVFNTQGQCLIDLWITSQLRVLNGRFVGDPCGNYTCHKSYGASTVDYALTDVDLINVLTFFHVSNPTYLSDHSQISVHVNCKINEHYSPNYNINHFINYSYKWESISRDN